MTCGPAAALGRDPLAPVLRCARCGAEERVPALPLFVVTGASGAGKTTVTGPLRRLLPDCAVFEADLTLQVAALGWETWRDTWLRLAHGEALNGRVTVLCGSLLPDQLERGPGAQAARPDSLLRPRLPRRRAGGTAPRPPVLAAQLAGDRDRGAPAFRRVAPRSQSSSRATTPARSRPTRRPRRSRPGSGADWTVKVPGGASPYARVMTPEALVRSGTSWAAVPFVPEISLLTAAEPFGLWDLTERDAPPFWAFPWAGGQALARYVLDHPEIVRGRRVLDAASGSGLVAIAAAKAGAASVTACDVDPNAVAAIGINARANDAATVAARVLDLAADDPSGAQVVLAADVFYQRELAELALRFLRGAARSGAEVFVADPGRAFLPATELTPLASFEVPVLTVLEDASVKRVTVYGLASR